MYIYTVRALVGVLLLFPYLAFATTAYQGATLIDGTHSGALENATILVQGEKIVAAGANIETPEDTKVVDVSGKWIVPGLIDAHILL